MSSKIELTRGKFAVVDEEDFIWLMLYTWTAVRRGKTWYAQTHLGDREYVLMHQLIFPHLESCTDHINGDGLDNRKENLRPVSKSANALNNNCRGVRLLPSGKWNARITIERKEISKTFDTEHEALEWRRKKVTSFLS